MRGVEEPKKGGSFKQNAQGPLGQPGPTSGAGAALQWVMEEERGGDVEKLPPCLRCGFRETNEGKRAASS